MTGNKATVVAGILRSPLLMMLGIAVSAHAQVFTQAQFTNVNYVNGPPGPDLNVPLLREGNIKLGPIALHPHFGIAEAFTDNEFRLSRPFGPRERDFIASYAPGFQAQLRILGRHRLVLDYMANIDRHSRFEQDNTEDQSRAAQLLLDFPGGLSAKALAAFKDGHDPRGSAVSTAGIGSEPNKWFTSTYGGEIQFARQVFARLRAMSTRWEFIGLNAGSRDGSLIGDINTRNRLENYAALAVGRRVAPKTYLFIEGSAAEAIYEINKTLDSSTYIGNLGVKWDVTDKTHGEVKAGWTARTLDRATTRGEEKFSGLHVNGNLFWEATERTRLTLFLYRLANETVLPATTFYVSTGAQLNLTHAFTRKWRTTALFGYNLDRYSNPIFSDNKTLTRRDNYLTVGAGLWYQVQPWLGMRTTYNYSERLSNFDSGQYNANSAMISLQALF